jgi:hypothetical protein
MGNVRMWQVLRWRNARLAPTEAAYDHGATRHRQRGPAVTTIRLLDACLHGGSLLRLDARREN